MQQKWLWLATGGTIAQIRGIEGLVPGIPAELMLDRLPELHRYGHVDVHQLMNKDGTHMGPREWMQLVRTIAAHHDVYDGVIITHGTDTLAYAAAALSFMIQDLNKPVIITGSSLPFGDPETDATRNLQDAFRFANLGWSGVYVVFHGKVISGTHAVKVRTQSRDMFESVNAPLVANLDGISAGTHGREITKHNKSPRFYPQLDTRVAVIKLTPGLSGTELHPFARPFRGLVVEAFGSGGIPFEGDDAALSAIRTWIRDGVVVVASTQCWYEGTDLSKYQVGRKAAEAGVVSARDMTTGAALMKLMWALAQSDEPDIVKHLFQQR